MSTIQDSGLLERLDAGPSPARAGAAGGDVGQSQFFELMIAQMKNQDPTKPLDSSQYLSQLAQFSTASGIQGLQQSIEQMSGSLQALHTLQASSLVGRQVVIEGDTAQVNPGEGLRASVELPPGVTDLTVSVVAPGGRVVRRMDLGSHPGGELRLGWDGLDQAGQPLPAGPYTLRAEGLSGGVPASFTTRIHASVRSVSLGQGGQGMTLNLAGGLGSRDISDVREIL